MRVLGTYQDYEIAKQKLKLAEETSDLNTDGEASKVQRKIKRKKVIESSEDDSETDETFLKLKPFPKLSGSISKTLNNKVRLSSPKPLRNKLDFSVHTSRPAEDRANTRQVLKYERIIFKIFHPQIHHSQHVVTYRKVFLKNESLRN
ncbi:hypothetical protein FQR65_LT15313 [Abscondita terminalis]|nr:hypothetical protein FQR65_LT15313 [Abscondita terminalis]